MSRSTDPDHFFQTSHSVEETKRRKEKAKNENGNPIRLQGKILAVIADPAEPAAVFVAQSTGTARRVVLETRTTSEVYSGPTAPLTSLAINLNAKILFAGCWDKRIWSWSTQSKPTGTQQRGRRYNGHNDFVKAVLCIQVKQMDILISGSADACIIIWNVETGERLHTLKGGHTRGILHLAVDPTTYPVQSPSNDEEGKTSIVLFSASSDREIRRWYLSTDLASASEIDTDKPIVKHETSVFNLCFDNNDDLWTGSADGRVKCLSRERNWEADTILVHGDYVDSVVVNDRWTVTAGRDEDIKVWDSANGKLFCTYSGHFEEITGLLLPALLPEIIVSVGIDATIRQWSLKLEDLTMARLENRKLAVETGEESSDDTDTEEVYDPDEDDRRTRGVTIYTEIEEDEEAELDALMREE